MGQHKTCEELHAIAIGKFLYVSDGFDLSLEYLFEIAQHVAKILTLDLSLTA